MKSILILIVTVLFLACTGNFLVEKPKKMIPEEKMIDILYDLSILQSIKSINPSILEQKKITPTSYIYSKYDIDSLQFAQNDHYYASDVELYEQIYDKVNERILKTKKKIDSVNTKGEFY